MWYDMKLIETKCNQQAPGHINFEFCNLFYHGWFILFGPSDLNLCSKFHMIMQRILFCFLGLLDGYERLCTACLHLGPVLAELEHEHLCRFSLTWEVLNKYLHQSIIYSDPIIQANVPIFISQVRMICYSCVTNIIRN